MLYLSLCCAEENLKGNLLPFLQVLADRLSLAYCPPRLSGLLSGHLGSVRAAAAEGLPKLRPSVCLSICQAAYRSSQARSLGGQGVWNQFPLSFSHHRVESKISHVSGCVCASPVTLVMSDSSAASRTIVRQAPLSMGFSQQEYWSELLWPLSRESSQPRDRTHISCVSCTAGRFFITEPLGRRGIKVITGNR